MATTTFIYVPNYSSNTVSVISGYNNTVTATISVGTNPSALAVNSSTNTIYVTNLNSSGHTVSVINA